MFLLREKKYINKKGNLFNISIVYLCTQLEQPLLIDKRYESFFRFQFDQRHDSNLKKECL